MLSKLIKYLINRDYRFLVNASRGFYKDMPDEAYLRRVFKARMGYESDFEQPVTFSEKLQWLKLHDHNPAYHRMADKAQAKDYIAEKIGREYIIPTIGVYNSFDEIDFDKFPDAFVLKCTHDSGSIVICRDKASFDRGKAKKTINRFLKRDYESQWREWPYRDLTHRIIAEEYIEDPDGLTDYKVHCFNGEPKMILVCRDRYAASGMTEDFFTERWEHLPVRRPEHPNAPAEPEKPAQLDELLRLSRELSKGVPFVRVDFYIAGERILFSEITFYPAAGLTPFVPEEWDLTFGEWLELPGSVEA